MRPPVIPGTLPGICVTCGDEFCMPGRYVCTDCLLERRFAAWALADGEMPPSWEAESQTPRITEAPRQRSRQAAELAARVAVWGGVLVLWAFVAGWLLGRFA